METYYCKVYRDEIKQGWKKTVLITLDGVWNTDDTVIEWLDESPSKDSSVFREALEKIVNLFDEPGKRQISSIVNEASMIASKALAQYNAATPQTPIDSESDKDDQETLWDQFFDQIVWDERESNSEVNQIMKSLQRKYHITRK